MPMFAGWGRQDQDPPTAAEVDEPLASPVEDEKEDDDKEEESDKSDAASNVDLDGTFFPYRLLALKGLELTETPFNCSPRATSLNLQSPSSRSQPSPFLARQVRRIQSGERPSGF